MRLIVPLVAVTLALPGCIIYDNDCRECGDRPSDREPGQDTGGIDTEEPAPTWTYALTPAEAEAGEVFIASLKQLGEDGPGTEHIVGLEFYGPVEVLAGDARAWEYLLTLAVAPEAGESTADLLVELDDGTAVWVEDILAIWPAGSGHDAGSSDDGSDPCA